MKFVLLIYCIVKISPGKQELNDPSDITAFIAVYDFLNPFRQERKLVKR